LGETERRDCREMNMRKAVKTKTSVRTDKRTKRPAAKALAAKPDPAVKELKKLLVSRRKEHKAVGRWLARVEKMGKDGQAQLKAIRKDVKLIKDARLAAAHAEAESALKVKVASNKAARRQYAAVDAAYERALRTVEQCLARPAERIGNKVGEISDRFFARLDELADLLSVDDKAASVARKTLATLQDLTSKMAMKVAKRR